MKKLLAALAGRKLGRSLGRNLGTGQNCIKNFLSIVSKIVGICRYTI